MGREKLNTHQNIFVKTQLLDLPNCALSSLRPYYWGREAKSLRSSIYIDQLVSQHGKLGKINDLVLFSRDCYYPMTQDFKLENYTDILIPPYCWDILLEWNSKFKCTIWIKTILFEVLRFSLILSYLIKIKKWSFCCSHIARGLTGETLRS